MLCSIVLVDLAKTLWCLTPHPCLTESRSISETDQVLPTKVIAMQTIVQSRARPVTGIPSKQKAETDKVGNLKPKRQEKAFPQATVHWSQQWMIRGALCRPGLELAHDALNYSWIGSGTAGTVKHGPSRKRVVLNPTFHIEKKERSRHNCQLQSVVAMTKGQK